jgi:antitoxin (DNA-binding transcriptional repressor) of toxin-antitoxin stability system
MVWIGLDEMNRDQGKDIREVEAGETVVVALADRPVAEIRPIRTDGVRLDITPRPVGLAAGEFRAPHDFDAPLPADLLDAFEGR